MRLFPLASVALACGLVASPARAELIVLGNTGMVYDTVQDLTWLQDPLLTQTLGLSPNGRLTNTDAVAWVEALTFGGYDDWRLPRMTQSRPGYVDLFYDSRSEISTLMAGLGWYWDLDALRANTDPPHAYTTDHDNYYIHGSTGPFMGFDDPTQVRRFWVESNQGPGPGTLGCAPYCFAWFTSYELEYAAYHSDFANVWAVRDGISRVPEPSTLMLTALGLLGALRRHRTNSRQ